VIGFSVSVGFQISKKCQIPLDLDADSESVTSRNNFRCYFLLTFRNDHVYQTLKTDASVTELLACCQMKRGTSLLQSVLMLFLMISQDREVNETVFIIGT